MFGNISQNQMLLNDAGAMVSEDGLALHTRFPSVILDEFIVMPNHFHGIIYISPDSIADADGKPFDNQKLDKIIGTFKSIVNNNYITGVKISDWQPFNKRLWPRNYYEHIVREDAALEKIQAYIQNNPLTWQLDSLHPDVESKY